VSVARFVVYVSYHLRAMFVIGTLCSLPRYEHGLLLCSTDLIVNGNLNDCNHLETINDAKKKILYRADKCQ
jgi:chorismate mutase